jgi:PRC-barrel domain
MKKVMAGALGAMMMGGVSTAALAECAINNQQADAELRKVEGIFGSDYGTLRRDMRQLRSAALILQRYGEDEACQEVVETINQVLRDPRAAMTNLNQRSTAAGGVTGEGTAAETNTTAQTGTTGAGSSATNAGEPANTGAGTVAGTNQTTGTGTGSTTDQTGSTSPAMSSMDDRRTAAVPLADSQRATSTAELIGSDVYGPDNESVGEIEDIIIGSSNQPGYAVISFGGFLGLGEEQVAVPLSAIRISEDDYLFVTFDRARLEAAPKIRRGSSDWLTDNDWRTQNDAYYTGNQ